MSAGEMSCRAPSPTRCVAHTRLYHHGRLVEEGFHVDLVSDHLADPDRVVWLDLLDPDEADMAVLVDELGLHPLAIEDALHAHQRPKLDVYADHLFLAAYAVLREDGQLVTSEVAAFLTPRALVTVRKDARIALAPVIARWDAGSELAGSGVSFLGHGLLDVLVDGYVQAAQDLDDAADGLEDALLAEPQEAAVQRQAFTLRSEVTRLRRVVLPMREVVATMRRRDLGLADEQMAPYLRDVDDHVVRVLEAVDGVREQLATLLDTTIALQGQRLNATLFKLTAYAALLAVTTAITGFFGQNIPYPGIGQRSGFIASVVVLVGSVAVLLVYFKRKGWL